MSQADSSELSTFGARLCAEREKTGLTQAEFAKKVGKTNQQQSLFETNRRDLRADYLAQIAALGLDVHYILTGQILETSPLPEDEQAVLAIYRKLDPSLRAIALRLLGSLGEQPAAAEDRSTLHSPAQEFRHNNNDRSQSP